MATTTAAKKPAPSMNRIMDQVAQEANWKREDEARLMPGPVIRTNKKYLFRFLPGTGPSSFSVKVDSLPDDFLNERQEQFHRRSYERRTRQTHGDKIYGEKPRYDLDSIRQKLGRNWIRFISMPGTSKIQPTCYYATDDPEIAAYLRHFVMLGKREWKYVREERPTEKVEIGGISVPNTTEGWEVARVAAQRTAMELEEEE